MSKVTDPAWYRLVATEGARLNIVLHELLTGEHCHVWRDETVPLPPGPGGVVPRGIGMRGECVRCGSRFDTTNGQPRTADGNKWPDYSGGWLGVGLVIEAMEQRGFTWSLEARDASVTAGFQRDEGDACPWGLATDTEPAVAVASAAIEVLRDLEIVASGANDRSNRARRLADIRAAHERGKNPGWTSDDVGALLAEIDRLRRR